MGNSEVAYRISERIRIQREIIELWNSLTDEQRTEIVKDFVPTDGDPLTDIGPAFQIVYGCYNFCNDNMKLRFEGPIWKPKNVSLGFGNDVGNSYWYSRVWCNGTKFNFKEENLGKAVGLGAFALLYLQEQLYIDEEVDKIWVAERRKAPVKAPVRKRSS